MTARASTELMCEVMHKERVDIFSVFLLQLCIYYTFLKQVTLTQSLPKTDSSRHASGRLVTFKNLNEDWLANVFFSLQARRDEGLSFMVVYTGIWTGTCMQ
jgi:hypothetical protein